MPLDAAVPKTVPVRCSPPVGHRAPGARPWGVLDKRRLRRTVTVAGAGGVL